MSFELTEEIRSKLTKTIEAGLVSGVGKPVPGEMCIESAICYALGEPHGDRPSCVAPPDRDWFIRLNDARWPSNEGRAKAFMPIAFAQLGTAGTDRSAWVRRVVDGTIQRVLPMSMRLTAELMPDGEIKTALLEAAARCELDGNAASARSAQAAWRKAADAADADAAASAASTASASASAASAAYAYADASAAYAYADASAAYASASAAYASAAYASASAAYASAAYADDDAARVTRLRVLHEAISVALDAYRAEGRA